MTRPARLTAGLLTAALLCAGPAAGDEVDKQRQRLARASDPVSRAKITVKLGEALLDTMARAFRDARFEEGERILAEYCGAVLAAGRDLLASGHDARRSPGGFKHLEIHIRKGERRLEEMSHTPNYEGVEKITETRAELESLRQDLLAALMHVEPPPPAEKGSGKEQHL